MHRKEDMLTINAYFMPLLLAVGIALQPPHSHAVGCLSHCTGDKTSAGPKPETTFLILPADPDLSSEVPLADDKNSTTVSGDNNRVKSHDANNVKNTIFGDVSIRIGHEGLEIREVGSNSTIDNSITTSIILGDLQQ